MKFYKIYIYRPDWVPNRNIPRSGLYDLKGNPIDQETKQPKKVSKELPFGRKDYQIEVSH